MSNNHFSLRISVAAAFALISGQVFAVCPTTFTDLKNALDFAVEAESSGLNNPMWATVVDRDGTVCAVAFSGLDRSAVWPGSRVISAQKANTGNAFSTNELSLSTANLYSAVQPGGSLFGLQESNPVDASEAYDGNPNDWGTGSDPLAVGVGKRVGGINVFGGGLALYNGSGIVGGLGASGDTSCADHNIAWRIRALLNLDQVPAGVNPDPQRPDNIIFDLQTVHDKSKSGFGHPTCINTSGSDMLSAGRTATVTKKGGLSPPLAIRFRATEQTATAVIVQAVSDTRLASTQEIRTSFRQFSRVARATERPERRVSRGLRSAIPTASRSCGWQCFQEVLFPHSSSASSEAFPPIAAVLTETLRSSANRAR